MWMKTWLRCSFWQPVCVYMCLDPDGVGFNLWDRKRGGDSVVLLFWRRSLPRHLTDLPGQNRSACDGSVRYKSSQVWVNQLYLHFFPDFILYVWTANERLLRFAIWNFNVRLEFHWEHTRSNFLVQTEHTLIFKVKKTQTFSLVFQI